MSDPDDTPDGTAEQPQPRPPARPPGWRKATPEKLGAARRYGGPQTRPAARPASRPPTPGTLSGLPPSERPAARPPARRRADDNRPYLPPMPVTPVEGRAAPQPPLPEHAVRSDAPASEPVAAPTARSEPAPDQTPDQTPTHKPNPKPAPKPASSSAATRAATARPHARTRTTQPARATRPAAARPTASMDRLTAGDGEGWLVLLLLGAFGIVLSRVAPDLPTAVREVSAVVVSGTFGWGLAIRTGGRPFWAAGLAAVLGTTAVVSDWHPLVAGAAIGTGVMGATLAVMATTPAATFLLAIREAVIASAVAALGAIGVVGYGVDKDTEIDPDRLGYAVLALALAGTFALVYRLGAGLHGLGRRGYAVAGGAVLMLVVAMAYSEAIAHWGSRDFVGMMDDFRDSTRDTLGAVPHPIVALLGYPALVWGVFMRARRRQGWWVCAFGVAATAPITTRLVSADLGVRSVVFGGVYSFLIGIALGYLAIRVEQSLTGSHGRRARRDEEAEAHRPEPRRTRALH